MGRLDPAKLHSGRDYGPCRFGELLVSLDADDVQLLEGAVIEGASYAALARWLTDADMRISETTVRAHLRGVCACGVDIRLKGVR